MERVCEDKCHLEFISSTFPLLFGKLKFNKRQKVNGIDIDLKKSIKKVFNMCQYILLEIEVSVCIRHLFRLLALKFCILNNKISSAESLIPKKL